MTRYRPALVLAAASLAALTACSSSTGGTATVTPSTTTNSPASASPVAQELKALDPCSMIPASTASSLHLTKQGRHDLTSPVAWGCDWQATAAAVGTANIWSLRFSIYPDDSATDVNTKGQTMTNISTNGRPGVQLDNGYGSCTVTMAITDTSSAEVIASSDDSRACGLANNIAQIVEPELPKG